MVGLGGHFRIRILLLVPVDKVQLSRIGLAVDEMLRALLQTVAPVHVKLQEAVHVLSWSTADARVILRIAVDLERVARVSNLSGRIRVERKH